MRGTLDTLEAAQRATGAVLVDKVAENPLRAGGLALPRLRNTALDSLFYDVSVITSGEIDIISKTMAHEGAILIVPPSDSDAAMQRFDNFEAFAASGEKVVSIAVAGVGSSALGGAALARNVADAIEGPVGVVVSGYGFADLATEALGGWFWFGALNSARHAFEWLDDLSRNFASGAHPFDMSSGLPGLRLSKDVDTLIRIFEAEPEHPIDLLVGHSKGNLVIAEALYWLHRYNPVRFEKLTARCNIVTLCAKIEMPKGCSPVIDITGEYDGLGALNSRPGIPSEHVVPHAWHSTNRDFPFKMGLDVTEAIRAVKPMFNQPPSNLPPAPPPVPFTDLPQAATALIPR